MRSGSDPVRTLVRNSSIIRDPIDVLREHRVVLPRKLDELRVRDQRGDLRAELHREAPERRERAKEACEVGEVPDRFDVVDSRVHEQDVDRAVSRHLVREMHVAVPREPGSGLVLHRPSAMESVPRGPVGR
jgi:hypothetical protein